MGQCVAGFLYYRFFSRKESPQNCDSFKSVKKNHDFVVIHCTVQHSQNGSESNPSHEPHADAATHGDHGSMIKTVFGDSKERRKIE